MDPGLLTLGALTIGATALLPQFLKSRKEGFEVVPARGYPAVAEKGNEIYNNLTLASDPRSEAVRVSGLSDSTQKDYKDAVDQVFKIPTVTFNRNEIIVKNEDTKNPVYLPDDDSIVKRAAYCVKMPISEKVFSDPQFNRDCGVCLTQGETHDNKPFRGAKGMFILPNEKAEYIEKREVSQNDYSNGKPSYGFCKGATGGLDHDYTFALDSKELKPLTERQKCIHNRPLDGNCAVCIKDSSFTYVSKDERTLAPTTFYLYGNNAWVEVSMGGTRIDFNPPKKEFRVLLNNSSKTFKIVLTEGAFMNVNVTGYGGGESTNKFTTAEVWGFMEFPNSTGGMEQIALDRILLKDERLGTTPRYAKSFVNVNGIYCRKMVKRSGQEVSVLTGQLPFLIVSDFPFEGIDCKSSMLQTLATSVDKFGADPCFKPSTQGPGTWTDACLRDRIQTMGCVATGNLYKDPSSLRNMSMTDIIQTVQEVASKQYTDNTNSMKCNGRNISTPCDGFIRFDPEETPELTDQCIEFLYYNRGVNSPQIGGTYNGPTEEYYSIDRNGKKIMCIPGGKMDPSIQNASVMNYLKSIYRNGYNGPPGLDSVKRFMNLNYNRAVNTSLDANTNDEQGGRKNSIENCYATLANIPQVTLPGRTAAKLPKARYARVRYPDGRRECIQISQLVVLDDRGINVAKGKPTKASSVWANGADGARPERAVDGVESWRGHPFQFHNQCGPNEFWMVDFGATFPIKTVKYFNRSDCCWTRANGMMVELLDENMNAVWQQLLDFHWGQVYHTNARRYNV